MKPSQAQEQNVTDPETTGNSIFKLISSPITILKSIVKLRKHDNSNKEIKSKSTVSPEAAPDNRAGKNGNGKKQDVPIETTSNDSMIPMGDNRIPEHDESFRDF
jgi:hypothetical protein